MTASVTRLPCATYRTDIPASLRAMADQIESGQLALPDLIVTVTSDAEGVQVFTQGVRADDDIQAIGLLEMGKGLVIINHAGCEHED